MRKLVFALFMGVFGMVGILLSGQTVHASPSGEKAVSGPIYYGYTVDSLAAKLEEALSRAFSGGLTEGRFLAYGLQSIEAAFPIEMGFEAYVSKLSDDDRLTRGVPLPVRPGSTGMVLKSDSMSPGSTPREQFRYAMQAVADLNILVSSCRSDQRSWNEQMVDRLMTRVPVQLELGKLRVLHFLKTNDCVSQAWYDAKAWPLVAFVAGADYRSDDQFLLAVVDLLRGGFGAWLTSRHIERLVEAKPEYVANRAGRQDSAMLEAYALASLIAAHEPARAEQALLKHGRKRLAIEYCGNPDGAPPGVDLTACEPAGE